MVLKLKKSHVNEMVAHVRTDFPLEASGLLAGRDGCVEQVYCMKNADQSETSYRLDPEEQYRVFMEIEENNLELIGIYHSHPKSSAYPSPRDVDMAYYPEAVYLIISLIDREAPDIRAFHIQDEKIMEQDIEIISEAS